VYRDDAKLLSSSVFVPESAVNTDRGKKVLSKVFLLFPQSTQLPCFAQVGKVWVGVRGKAGKGRGLGKGVATGEERVLEGKGGEVSKGRRGARKPCRRPQSDQLL